MDFVRGLICAAFLYLIAAAIFGLGRMSVSKELEHLKKNASTILRPCEVMYAIQK